MILAFLMACIPGSDGLNPEVEGGGEETGSDGLAELHVTISDSKEDCDEGVVALELIVSNFGDVDVDTDVGLVIYQMPDLLPIYTGSVSETLPAGQNGETIVVAIDMADIGSTGLMVEIDGIDAVEEYDLLSNMAIWDHLCCPEDIEESTSRGEIWGVASANMGAWDYWGMRWHEPYGERPGSAIWRLDLDTMQPEIVRVFDPELHDIWYLGGLALHPTEPLVYVTALSYDLTGDFEVNAEETDWLEGYDTLLAINTDTYAIEGQWDLDPQFYYFTGLASDFEPGQGGTYSPGGLQFIDGELYAVEGMTVHNSDLIWIDMSSGEPELSNVSIAYDWEFWGGGIQTDNNGVRYATCNPVPESNYDPDDPTVEISWIPEPAMWIEFDLNNPNDCDDPLFTFEQDRIHGVTLDGADTLHAARSAVTYWYLEADGDLPQPVDLQLYEVADDGSMTPYFDMATILGTVAAPIDGIANIDWRSM